MSENFNRELKGLEYLITNSVTNGTFSVKFVYNTRVKSDWKITGRRMSRWLMVYFRDGEGSYFVEDQVIHMKAGGIILLSPNLSHSIRIHPENPPLFISVHFNLMNQNGELMMLECKDPFFIALDTQPGYPIQSAFEALKEQFIFDGTINIIENHSNLLTILLHIYRQLNAQKGADNYMHPKVKKAKELVDYYLYDHIGVNEIAKEVGLNRKYLSQLFKNYYKTTLKNYQIVRRIEVAKGLLKETGMSVSEVSKMMNYPDPYTFSKQFKKVVGYPPSDVVEKAID